MYNEQIDQALAKASQDAAEFPTMKCVALRLERLRALRESCRVVTVEQEWALYFLLDRGAQRVDELKAERRQVIEHLVGWLDGRCAWMVDRFEHDGASWVALSDLARFWLIERRRWC